MTELRQALAAADAALRAAVDSATFSRSSDADLMRAGREIEAVARLLDASRVLHAGEVARRAESRTEMVAAFGYRGSVDAVAGVAGISGGAAKQRIRTGAAILPRTSVSGAIAPPRLPVIAAAVRSGGLGIESAGYLVAQLETVSPRVDAVVLRRAEQNLVDAAAGTQTRPPLSVELVRREAATVVAQIDPAGVRSREERALSRRSFRFGREDADGLTPVHGVLLPVVAARFQRLCDAFMRTARPVFVDRDAASGDESDHSSDTSSPHASEGGKAPGRVDSRTREQQRHDVLGSLLDAASRVADAPHLAGAPPAVLVTVGREALDSRRGVGFIDGMETPISIDAVEQLVDTAGAQKVALDDGAVLALGSVQRCFTPLQRRAITARDGGCLIPGCPIPAGWCEVHHVVPHRSGGATHVSNGVLLCWWHHHAIDSGPWRLQMLRGVPHVRGPGLSDWVVATKRRTAIPGYDPPPPPGAAAPPPAEGHT